MNDSSSSPIGLKSAEKISATPHSHVKFVSSDTYPHSIFQVSQTMTIPPVECMFPLNRPDVLDKFIFKYDKLGDKGRVKIPSEVKQQIHNNLD
jgi:hypothetical protein